MFTYNNVVREVGYGLVGISVFDGHGTVYCEALGTSQKKALAKAMRIVDLLNQYGQ